MAIFGVPARSVTESHLWHGTLFYHFRLRYNKAEAEQDRQKADWILQGGDPKKNLYTENSQSFWTYFDNELETFSKLPDEGLHDIKDIKDEDIWEFTDSQDNNGVTQDDPNRGGAAGGTGGTGDAGHYTTLNDGLTSLVAVT
ncbi:hypothetical protein DFS34DRAFT_590344 [Phlyctochytrium arcticum]|nr:hypothetical protein DFS34DRAFT_590344 [Phlyctochytrium arcticum]